jgi:2-polyprenyl-6-methoxyphenol hydroxylase-like FAD-dependent oxidoreductase
MEADRAIVLGGGVTGLTAALALRGAFDEVLVLEPHSYPLGAAALEPPRTRRGVPQSRCLHMLMGAGAEAFDQLAPGWRDAAVALGAVPFDAGAGSALHLSGGWLARLPAGIPIYGCSRWLIEEVLRSFVVSTGPIVIREGWEAVGLAGSVDSGIMGVRARARHSHRETLLACALVVEATGRGSRLPDWLAAVDATGKARVPETVVDCGRQYVSQWYHLEEPDAPDWCYLSIAPVAGAPHRSGMMVRAEGGRWSVVLLADARAELPVDDEEMLAFAGSLADGALARALVQARPISPVYRYGQTSSRVRHFERITAWPEGVVALGDAACALDPFFGLGMTQAARAALLLKDHANAGLGGPRASAGTIPSHAWRFQADLAARLAPTWSLVTGRRWNGAPIGPSGASGAADAVPVTDPVAVQDVLLRQHLIDPRSSRVDEAARGTLARRPPR